MVPPRHRRLGALAGCSLGLLGAAEARGDLPAHLSVAGAEIATVELRAPHTATERVAWGELMRPRAPGAYSVRFPVSGVEAVEVPTCAGRRRVLLDGRAVPSASPAPVVVRLSEGAHELTLEVAVSGYEKRIACSGAPRVGAVRETREGLGVLSFASPHHARGGGRAVVFVPPGHDLGKRGALLVGAHPWDGSPWTYAAYAELLREAAARDVVLLLPSGLGNSLYTAPAEDEVLRAIDAAGEQLGIDPTRISLWGASMGGAGATTIGLHHPARFATVTSFFGDSRYDLSTYVRAILADEAAAHAVNALDVVDNARHVPVWLVHGEADHVSPITQSSMLARALTERGYAVRFDRVPGMGHEGTLVARYAPELVELASQARAPEYPGRVSFRSVRAEDVAAYGVRIVRAGGDAHVELERRADGVHVLRATGVKAILLAPRALGGGDAPIVLEAGVGEVPVRWEHPPATDPP